MFDGQTYDPTLDAVRLTTQLGRVLALMADGEWRTLREIQWEVGGTEAAVSARLRDFRKKKFGGHTVERRRRDNPHLGLFEYRLLLQPNIAVRVKEKARNQALAAWWRKRRNGTRG